MVHRISTLVVAVVIAACNAPAGVSSPSPLATVAPSAAAIATATPPASPEPAATAGPMPQPEPTGPASCPIDFPITVTDFLRAELACFGDADVQILGWLDGPPPHGFDGPLIRPTWLAYPPDSLYYTLTSVQPSGPDNICPGDCRGFFVHLRPDSTVVLEGPGRWVIATGHRLDPASERCHFDYPDGWVDPPLDEASARRTCRRNFVLTAIADAP